MTRLIRRLAPFALLAAALPCLADSMSASSASDSVSASIGKSSDSITTSSADSSRGDHQALGDYKVIDVADVEGKPGMVRLHLQPVAQGDDVMLLLPRQAADHGHVAKDAIVTATTRPYGIEFTAGQPREAFFLALSDDWSRELVTSPLTL